MISPFDNGIPRPQELIMAEEKANALSLEFSREGMQIIDSLLQEIDGMQLASRFDRNTTLEQIENRVGERNFSPQAIIAVRQEGEAGLKKVQLKTDVEGIRTELITLSHRLRSIAIDIEASKTD